MDKNTVIISGYLKENTLEQVVSKNGKNAIRGNLVIATSPIESHRVQFFVNETTSAGEESKDYAALSALLPTKTITLASYLEANPEATFETACDKVSKVWATGYLDEFVRKDEEKGEISSVQVRGRRAGIKSPTSGKPFTPRAEFEAEIYISEISKEVDKAGAETGRVNVVGLIPNYDQSVLKIPFVAPTENGVAAYILGNYKVSDTTHINGQLVNTVNRVLVESGSTNHFGTGGRDQYSTTFVNERRILGGDATPIHQGEEGAISQSAAKIGLAKRESKAAANAVKPQPAKANFNTPKAPAATARASAPSADDMDF